jgi:hypothetical protein
MNKFGTLRGTGALRLDGDAIAKAQYEILINEDEAGKKLAFGSLQVSHHTINLVDVSDGDYSLELEGGATIELVLTEIGPGFIKFDINGPIPGF